MMYKCGRCNCYKKRGTHRGHEETLGTSGRPLLWSLLAISLRIQLPPPPSPSKMSNVQVHVQLHFHCHLDVHFQVMVEYLRVRYRL